jgi:hypothetical protein
VSAAIYANEEAVRHLMNESFRQKYLVPNETPTEEERPSLEDPESSANPSIEAPEHSSTEPKGGSGSGNEAQLLQETDASQTCEDPATDTEPRLNKSNSDTDEHTDSKSDAGQMDAEQTFDLTSEIGTVADSDVDQADPMWGPFDSKPPEEFRYEINYCHYHLTKVEELWESEDRQGSAWDDFESLRDAFFQDESVFFQSWSNLMEQVPWGWSWPSQALHCAARLGLTSLVERLVTKGADISKRNNGENALDYAIQYYAGAKEDEVSNLNCLRLFETLLRAGINVNMRGEKGGFEFLTFRFLLVQNAEIDAVELFLKYGADAKAINDGTSISVLHTCVQFCEKAEVLKAILSGGADPNAKDGNGETALHHLMQRSKVPEGFLQQLLDAKANVNEEDLSSQRMLLCHYGLLSI